MTTKFALALCAVTTFFLSAAAFAQGADTESVSWEDVPVNGAITLRDPVTPIAGEVRMFHDFILLPVMVGISVLVLGLLVWVVLRYGKGANAEANKFSHNTKLEVVWTVIPALILVFIAFYSFPLLYKTDRMPDGQVYEYAAGTRSASFPNDFTPNRMVQSGRHLEVALVDTASGDKQLLALEDDYDVEGFGSEELIINLARPVPEGSRLRVVGGQSRVGRTPFLGMFGDDTSQIVPAPTVTIKAMGFQWGWAYSYPDFGDWEFTSLIAPRKDVSPQLYRLATTNDVVVPAGETVRIITGARDVIHSWAMPAFAVKVDAIPGRLNETWFYTEQEGTYYGQCSEICGIDHAYMPISVRVVSRPEFEAWVDERREFEGLEPLFDGDDQLAAGGSPAIELN